MLVGSLATPAPEARNIPPSPAMGEAGAVMAVQRMTDIETNFEQGSRGDEAFQHKEGSADSHGDSDQNMSGSQELGDSSDEEQPVAPCATQALCDDSDEDEEPHRLLCRWPNHFLKTAISAALKKLRRPLGGSS